VRIGTRASPLALAQARQIAALLPGAELVEITTSGDRDRALPDKEKWVKELDAALLDGRVDACVHSAKDVPTTLPEGIVIAAVPAREDPRDVLVGAGSLEGLADGARVGTSSLRRRTQLLAQRPDLAVAEVRGNVGTRLAKLAAGEVDALVLAAAGLRRLDLPEADSGAALDVERFVPAAGQGTLAITCRATDDATRALLSSIDDGPAHAELLAERTVVGALGADCHSAIGVHADRAADSGLVTLRAWVGATDGSAVLTDGVDAAVGAELPTALLVERLITMGARELLLTGSPS
jgi:hydroxymethylbilane synthase